MRRLIGLLCLGALMTAVPACKRREKARVQTVEESSTGLASTVSMGDPKQAPQLVKGFYDIEQNAWRWTAGKFSVVLKPPAGAAQKGATLVVHFAIPGNIIENLKQVTLTATVNGATLPGETYSKDGEQAYAKDVPASALGGDAVTVNFSLDKSVPAGVIDQRELGIVVTSIGLEAK